MRIVNGNHKPKRYSFPLPLIIRSDSPILITDGKAKLEHEGDITIRVADTQTVEFELQEPTKDATKSSEVTVQMYFEPSLPDGYVRFMEPTKSNSRGRAKSTYEYYRRDRDMSYLLLIRHDDRTRKVNLGSLFDSDSVIHKALREFSREKPFYRRDLIAFRMPDGLKQGQIIKACLDILTYEGFLERKEVSLRDKKPIDRYFRTEKKLP